MFLFIDPNEFVDRINLLHQVKKAGNDSENISDEIIATVDKLLEYGSVTKEDHTIFMEKDHLQV